MEVVVVVEVVEVEDVDVVGRVVVDVVVSVEGGIEEVVTAFSLGPMHPSIKTTAPNTAAFAAIPRWIFGFMGIAYI